MVINMTIKALVPIRLNSKRVTLKSIRKIKDIPLVEWTIRTLNEVKEIDEIIVYCSNEIIKEYINSKYTFIKRNPILDGDNQNIHNILHNLIKIDEVHADYWIIQQCTSPFIKSDTIETVLIKLFLGNMIQLLQLLDNKSIAGLIINHLILIRKK